MFPLERLIAIFHRCVLSPLFPPTAVHCDTIRLFLSDLVFVFHLCSLVAFHDRVSLARDALSVDLYSEVASLETLHLLERVSASDELDHPKFRCAVDTPTVERVAHKMELPLGKFLAQ